MGNSKSKSLEKIICDIPPMDFVLYVAEDEKRINDVAVVCYGGREFEVGSVHYCDPKQYVKCYQKYRSDTNGRE